MSIYAEMIQAGIEVDHHESDLYVKDCPTARAILANHGKRVDGHNVMPFKYGGSTWLDVPFEYQPFWDSKSVVSLEEYNQTVNRR